MARSFLFDLDPPPSAKLLGWRLLDVEPEAGRIRVAFDGTEDFLNPAGFIQGGMLSAMLDDTISATVAARTDGRLFSTTIDMNVSFIAPARPGTLVAEGRIVRLGKTIAFLEGELRDADDALLARATASARLIEGVFD